MIKNIKLKKKPEVLFHQWKSLKLVFYLRHSVGSLSNYALFCDFLVTRPVVIIIEDIIEDKSGFLKKHAIASYANTG